MHKWLWCLIETKENVNCAAQLFPYIFFNPVRFGVLDMELLCCHPHVIKQCIWAFFLQETRKMASSWGWGSKQYATGIWKSVYVPMLIFRLNLFLIWGARDLFPDLFLISFILSQAQALSNLAKLDQAGPNRAKHFPKRVKQGLTWVKWTWTLLNGVKLRKKWGA